MCCHRAAHPYTPSDRTTEVNHVDRAYQLLKIFGHIRFAHSPCSLIVQHMHSWSGLIYFDTVRYMRAQAGPQQWLSGRRRQTRTAGVPGNPGASSVCHRPISRGLHPHRVHSVSPVVIAYVAMPLLVLCHATAYIAGPALCDHDVTV